MSRFNFTYRYIDDVFPLITQSLRITWARFIPLNSRSKTRQRATLLLLTWIYFCQLQTSIYDKRDDFNLRITNFPFLAIFQHRSSMASLFHSLYDMPWLAPRTVIRQGTLEIVIEEVWSIRGSYQTIRSFPLTNVKWHSVTWPYTMTTAYWSDSVPNSTFYRILRGFHRTFATVVACRQGALTPPNTLSRLFETFPFSEPVFTFPNYALRISLGTFPILLTNISWTL